MQQPEERGRTWDEDEDARTTRRIRFGCTRTRDGTRNNQIMNEIHSTIKSRRDGTRTSAGEDEDEVEWETDEDGGEMDEDEGTQRDEEGILGYMETRGRGEECEDTTRKTLPSQSNHGTQQSNTQQSNKV